MDLEQMATFLEEFVKNNVSRLDRQKAETFLLIAATLKIVKSERANEQKNP